MYSSLFSTQKLPLVNMPSFSVKFSYVSSSSWMVIWNYVTLVFDLHLRLHYFYAIYFRDFNFW